MWIWTGSFLTTFLVLTSSSLASSEPIGPSADCRVQLLDRQGPNGSGGWVLQQAAGRPMLCLSGSLEHIDMARLLETIDQNPKLDVTVRTTGGPVRRWLEIAEHLLGRVDTLIVDEACFSSCANYLIPIASHVHAGAGSLVVWHGGPNSKSSKPLDGTDVSSAIDYDQITVRTEELYRKVGFSTGILALTSEIPSSEKIRSTVTSDNRSFPVSGYAVSPLRLLKCFGFKNVSGMWHAGNDKAVYELGTRRSRSLVLLENPKIEKNGKIKCDSGL